MVVSSITFWVIGFPKLFEPSSRATMAIPLPARKTDHEVTLSESSPRSFAKSQGAKEEVDHFDVEFWRERMLEDRFGLNLGTIFYISMTKPHGGRFSIFKLSLVSFLFIS